MTLILTNKSYTVHFQEKKNTLQPINIQYAADILFTFKQLKLSRFQTYNIFKESYTSKLVQQEKLWTSYIGLVFI